MLSEWREFSYEFLRPSPGLQYCLILFWFYAESEKSKGKKIVRKVINLFCIAWSGLIYREIVEICDSDGCLKPHHHFLLITSSLMSCLGVCLPALPGGKEHNHHSAKNTPYQSRGPMDSSHYRLNGTFQCYQQKSQIHHNYDRFVYKMECYLTTAGHFSS